MQLNYLICGNISLYIYIKMFYIQKCRDECLSFVTRQMFVLKVIPVIRLKTLNNVKMITGFSAWRETLQ